MSEICLVQSEELFDSLNFPGATYGRFKIEIDSSSNGQETRAVRLGLIALCAPLFLDECSSDEYNDFVTGVFDGYIASPHVSRVLPVLSDSSTVQEVSDVRMQILCEQHLKGCISTNDLAEESDLLEIVNQDNIQIIDSSGRDSEWDQDKNDITPSLFVADTMEAGQLDDTELEEIVGVRYADIRFYYQHPVRKGPSPSFDDMDRTNLAETVGFIDENGEFAPVATFLDENHYEKILSSQ